MTTLTSEMIDAGVSSNGGMSFKQLRLLGVSMPLKSGWRERLVGMQIPESDYMEFLSLKNAHLREDGHRVSVKAQKYRQAEANERALIIDYLARSGHAEAAADIRNLNHHPKLQKS